MPDGHVFGHIRRAKHLRIAFVGRIQREHSSVMRDYRVVDCEWPGKRCRPDSTASESLCPRRASMSTSMIVPLAALGLIRSPAKLAACVG